MSLKQILISYSLDYGISNISSVELPYTDFPKQW